LSAKDIRNIKGTILCRIIAWWAVNRKWLDAHAPYRLGTLDVAVFKTEEGGSIIARQVPRLAAVDRP